MEEIEVKKSRIPNIKDLVNYKDFFGDYRLIFAIKIISSIFSCAKTFISYEIPIANKIKLFNLLH